MGVTASRCLVMREEVTVSSSSSNMDHHTAEDFSICLAHSTLSLSQRFRLYVVVFICTILWSTGDTFFFRHKGQAVATPTAPVSTHLLVLIRGQNEVLHNNRVGRNTLHGVN